mgnify:CR=1 FL=1
MGINGKKRDVYLTPEHILTKVSEYDIFKYYMPHQFILNEVTISPFRNERNPSFIIGDRYGRISFIDFGDTSKRGSCFDFIRMLYHINLDEALEIYSKPKERRRGVAKPPVKELGLDPETQKPLIIKDGRFGMYVTDGETNATLRRGDTAEGMTLERGLELLAGRRAWEAENGPSPKKTRKKAAAKAKPGDTAPTLTKNVVKKAATKKAAAKKAATGKSKKAAAKD